MRLLACMATVIATAVSLSQSANGADEVTYVGKNGLILFSQTQSGAFTGYALLRLPDASSSNTIKLVGAELTEYNHSTSVQAQNWPRSHDGVVFKTNLPTNKYPEYLFLAHDDAASTSDAWKFPAAYKSGGEWITLGLFAKTPYETHLDARRLLKRTDKESRSYSGDEKESGY